MSAVEVLSHLNFDTDVVILFEKWHVTTIPGLIASCVLIVFLAFVFEVIKTYRSIVFKEATAKAGKGLLTELASKKPGLLKGVLFGDGKVRIIKGPYAIATLLVLIQRAIGYLLILIVVTYNGWLIMSGLVGIALGYIVTAWRRRQKDDDDDDDDDGEED